MADLGFPGGVVRAEQPAFQSEIWEVRKAGLNIMMSMKGDGKPVSFIEDCAVRLEELADYTDRLTQVFERYGTQGTWYAHASVGCLHVRPILNMKDGEDVKKMRAIAEEAFAMVREYKGSHSGEHGDGLVRSEFHEPMFGREITHAFERVKDAFDPDNRLNPGKIVRPPKMDDRANFRFKPGYTTTMPATALVQPRLRVMCAAAFRAARPRRAPRREDYAGRGIRSTRRPRAGGPPDAAHPRVRGSRSCR